MTARGGEVHFKEYCRLLLAPVIELGSTRVYIYRRTPSDSWLVLSYMDWNIPD